jgi:hypothetical protein
VDALGMVVNGYREFPLGSFLADHILVEEILNLKRPRNLVGAGSGRFRLIVIENRIANGNAFITDIGPRVLARRRYQFANNILALVTEGTA